MDKQALLIRKNRITVPNTVKVFLDSTSMRFEGPLGVIHFDFTRHDFHGVYSVTIDVSNENIQTIVICSCAKTFSDSLKGLFLMYITGVVSGYIIHLDLVGVGYKSQIVHDTLHLKLGFSHVIQCAIPSDIRMLISKSNRISLYGLDKARVNQIAAQLRSIKPPEAYKGKGIRLQTETIILKEGKKK
jgi:large subunit ribosomal protein L6